MMRVLLPKPPAGGRFDGLQPACKEITECLRSYCEGKVNEFENSQIRFFFKEDRPEDSKAQLVDCWIRAAEIFIQLQTQLPIVFFLDPFRNDIIGHQFNPTYVEAHRSQAFPEGSNRGKPISLIISPFVSLMGDEDGEMYHKERVVSKAIVKVLEFDSEL
jgi:hypothetical protein